MIVRTGWVGVPASAPRFQNCARVRGGTSTPSRNAGISGSLVLEPPPGAQMRISLSYQCGLAWDELEGGGSCRSCGECGHDVHDLSAMTRGEARRFVEAHRGERVCVAYIPDDDGNVVHRPRLRPPTAMAAAALTLPLLLAGCEQPGQEAEPPAIATPAAPEEALVEASQEPEQADPSVTFELAAASIRHGLTDGAREVESHCETLAQELPEEAAEPRKRPPTKARKSTAKPHILGLLME